MVKSKQTSEPFPTNTIDANGQETYYGYNPSGEQIFDYVYKTWTNTGGTAVSGWVGTTTTYNSNGQVYTTVENTYGDMSGETGDVHTLYTWLNSSVVTIDTRTNRGSGTVTPYETLAATQTTGTTNYLNGNTTSSTDQYGRVTRKLIR
jgi:hypothetical protein